MEPETKIGIRVGFEWATAGGCVIALVAGSGALERSSIVILVMLGGAAFSVAIFEHGWYKASSRIRSCVKTGVILAIIWSSMAFVGYEIRPAEVKPVAQAPGPPQHDQPSSHPNDSELSKQIADLQAKLSTLKAADTSNQLSSFTNERLDEMTNQTIKSLSEYLAEWSNGRYQIQRQMHDDLNNYTQTGHIWSREEELAITQKADKSVASRDTEMRKGLKGELKPVSALLSEIYNRFDFNQKKKSYLTYSQSENILKKLNSGNFELGDLRLLIGDLTFLETLLKTASSTMPTP